MKLFNTQACVSNETGTFAPWFTGSDATTKRDAAKSRAPRVISNAGPARPEPDAVQRGRGWSAVESIALSLFR